MAPRLSWIVRNWNQVRYAANSPADVTGRGATTGYTTVNSVIATRTANFKINWKFLWKLEFCSTWLCIQADGQSSSINISIISCNISEEINFMVMSVEFLLLSFKRPEVTLNVYWQWKDELWEEVSKLVSVWNEGQVHFVPIISKSLVPIERADVEVNISQLDNAGYWNIKYTYYGPIRSDKCSTFSFTDSPLSHSFPLCCSSTKRKLHLRGEEENVSDGKKRTDGLRTGTEILPFVISMCEKRNWYEAYLFVGAI